MARVCEICGKGRQVGNKMTIRGKAKYLGGVGTKVTGITRRTYLPNLQSVRVTTDNGTHKTIRLCVQCLRSGAVAKRICNVPFKMTAADKAAVSASQRKVPRGRAVAVKAEKGKKASA